MSDHIANSPYHIESGVPGNYAVYDERTRECVYRTNTWERAVARVRQLERRLDDAEWAEQHADDTWSRRLGGEVER